MSKENQETETTASDKALPISSGSHPRVEAELREWLCHDGRGFALERTKKKPLAGKKEHPDSNDLQGN